MRIAEAQLVRAAGELITSNGRSGAEVAQSLVQFLRRKRLTRRLGKITQALDRYLEQQSKTLFVTVTSARILDEVEQNEIKMRAAELLGKSDWQATLHFQVEPGLIGGVRLETSDTRYDQSVSRALKELHKSL